MKYGPNGGSYSSWKATDANGDAKWSVPAGTYKVKEETKSGWKATTDVEVSNVVVTTGQSTTVNFGNADKPIIEVFKFNDLNADGDKDPGEPFLSGWTFDLYEKDHSYSSWPATPISTKITGADGRVVWTDATGLTSYKYYKVVEHLQTGWVVTTPAANPRLWQVTGKLHSCTHKTLYFGNVECNVVVTIQGGCIEGQQTFTLTADTTGTDCAGNLYYQWYKGGVIIPGADSQTYTTNPGETGDYKVVVKCKIGSGCPTPNSMLLCHCTLLCEATSNEVTISLSPTADFTATSEC